MMVLFKSQETKYDVKLFKGKEAVHVGDCGPNQHKVNGKCVLRNAKSKESWTLTEPFGPFKDFDDCLKKLGSDEKCGALKRDLEQKLTETLKKGRLLESVNWNTWVQPTPEDNLIEAEVLHVTVSGNRVDYTKEELLPAVNTLIGKPAYWVDLQEATLPEDLHKDPKKREVGVVRLARFDNNTIHALIEVEPEIKALVESGIITQGSIEANFAVDSTSDKVIADRKPEFIQFEGFLLLPNEGTQTPSGPVGPPGDPHTKTEVFEQIKNQLGVCCLKGMGKGKPQKSLFF